MDAMALQQGQDSNMKIKAKSCATAGNQPDLTERLCQKGTPIQIRRFHLPLSFCVNLFFSIISCSIWRSNEDLCSGDLRELLNVD